MVKKYSKIMKWWLINTLKAIVIFRIYVNIMRLFLIIVRINDRIYHIDWMLERRIMLNKKLVKNIIYAFLIVAFTQLVLNLISHTAILYNVNSVIGFTFFYSLFLYLSDKFKHKQR